MTDARDDTPFDQFVVEDDPMPDGRTIHYYVWPDRAAPAGDEAGPASAEVAPAATSGGPAQPAAGERADV